MVGLTFIDVPLPSGVPPQEPLYQFQLAPLPSTPPEMPSIKDEPEQIVSLFVVIRIAAVEVSLTVITLLTQVVVLQIPSALT